MEKQKLKVGMERFKIHVTQNRHTVESLLNNATIATQQTKLNFNKSNYLKVLKCLTNNKAKSI